MRARTNANVFGEFPKRCCQNICSENAIKSLSFNIPSVFPMKSKSKCLSNGHKLCFVETNAMQFAQFISEYLLYFSFLVAMTASQIEKFAQKCMFVGRCQQTFLKKKKKKNVKISALG